MNLHENGVSSYWREMPAWNAFVCVHQYGRHVACKPASNRPFFSCALGALAFEWGRGWRWPCFVTNPPTFSCSNRDILMLTSPWTRSSTYEKQEGLWQNGVAAILASVRGPGHWAHNCNLAYCDFQPITYCCPNLMRSFRKVNRVMKLSTTR